MRLLLVSLLVSLPQLAAAEVTDMKCYVELQGGNHIVLQSQVNDSSKQGLEQKFMKMGYEVDGVLLSVVKVMECVPLDATFSSLAAKRQDDAQPR
ncbi:TapY2 family type IVa secretion system protein [Aeromonas caviae]|jgi:preprotein translocase subunit SecD|uniref:TapY2 family type IVa secretion system protein n=1 Tax=Aeromonas caviae TaxID=648 RepID=UPI0015DF3DB7|nr:TapY2 family type IVa secretion system protein [Aeromonas caviae]MBL0557121.1 TapY2 family type IVa secretion system protein [Aeromonas caviae]MDX7732382.1 TapY2 family type IVa secretion system protein [Aeromonas caviae]MEA9440386.1 TapY2 family type IVa secretion system protein [Aeromonas caviae]QLL83381.1 hypothetical protein GWG05_02915 [Aeromonas caviae]USP62939.1 TapY2 family type IVa secretion system protein [Aeromonas caviae]